MAGLTVLVILSRVSFPVYRFTDQFPWTPDVDTSLPDVLLIGDSVLMGYSPSVREALAGLANVYVLYEYAAQRLHSLFIGGPLLQPVNGGSTHRGLANLDEWLGEKEWDVIYFNWGIHDLRVSDSPSRDSVVLRRAAEEYAARLDTLVTRLRESDATLIFATTTPVGHDAAFIDGSVELYNDLALAVMARQGVTVHDLHAVVDTPASGLNPDRHGHFSREGSAELGGTVAKQIAEALAHH